MNKSEIAEPQQFTKRPITVTALQFAEDGSNWVQIHAFMGRQCPLNVPTFYAEVHTLEGMLMAKRGWWIIRGIEGEFYPCEPGIFVKTYESVERAIAESRAPKPSPRVCIHCGEDSWQHCRFHQPAHCKVECALARHDPILATEEYESGDGEPSPPPNNPMSDEAIERELCDELASVGMKYVSGQARGYGINTKAIWKALVAERRRVKELETP